MHVHYQSVVADDYFLAADAGYGHLLCILWGDSEQTEEFLEDFGTGPGLVFLNDVAHLIEHHQLEAALHLSNGKVLVHPVAPRKE